MKIETFFLSFSELYWSSMITHPNPTFLTHPKCAHTHIHITNKQKTFTIINIYDHSLWQIRIQYPVVVCYLWFIYLYIDLYTSFLYLGKLFNKRNILKMWFPPGTTKKLMQMRFFSVEILPLKSQIKWWGSYQGLLVFKFFTSFCIVDFFS